MKTKIGQLYFTFWQTSIAGPFCYQGGDNYCFSSMIVGELNSLLRAQEAFDYMFERWTFDSDRGEFADQIADVMSDEAIDREAAKFTTSPKHSRIFVALKENRSAILRTVGR